MGGHVGVGCDGREMSEELCEVLGYLRVKLWVVILFCFFLGLCVGMWGHVGRFVGWLFVSLGESDLILA